MPDILVIALEFEDFNPNLELIENIMNKSISLNENSNMLTYKLKVFEKFIKLNYFILFYFISF